MAGPNELQKNLEAALTKETRINLDQCELQITIENQCAILTGRLDTVATKRLACNLARQISGIEEVRDKTLVKRVEEMGDREIVDHINRSFVQDGNIELENIQIDVDKEGRVTLDGSVHSLMQKRLCEVLCWWVPGVTAVDNRLTLDPPEQDNDAELRDNLLVILSKDRLIQPEYFKLLVRDAIVRLEGRIGSEAEKEAIENACWYCPGIRDVDNRLQVG